MSASEGVAVLGPERQKIEEGNYALPWSVLRYVKPKQGEESWVRRVPAPCSQVL